MKLDYLVMCSKCEVRIHPDDYKKHKKTCCREYDYIPMPYLVYPYHLNPPWNPNLWWGTTPYVHTTTADTSSIGVSYDSATFGSTYLAGTTLTHALSS